MNRMLRFRDLLELPSQLEGFAHGLSRLSDSVRAFERELFAARRLAPPPTPRYPVTVLILGEAFDGASSSPTFGSKTVWMLEGTEQEVQFNFQRVLKAGAWVIVLGGAQLARLRVGSNLCGLGAEGMGGAIGRTDQPAQLGMYLFCLLRCGPEHT